jgi:hypothetical protein
MSGLCPLWSNEAFRRSLIAALWGWNCALREGWPEQLRAAGLLKQIFGRLDSASTFGAHDAARASETPAQTLDRLLEFPSHRLAVYGSLAPAKRTTT